MSTTQRRSNINTIHRSCEFFFSIQWTWTFLDATSWFYEVKQSGGIPDCTENVQRSAKSRETCRNLFQLHNIKWCSQIEKRTCSLFTDRFNLNFSNFWLIGVKRQCVVGWRFPLALLPRQNLRWHLLPWQNLPSAFFAQANLRGSMFCLAAWFA